MRLLPMLVIGKSHGKETAMEIRMGSGEGPMVQSPSRCIQDFAQQTMIRQREWAEQLLKAPDDFAHIEQEIDQHFRNGAGHFVAAVLAQVSSQPDMAEHTERIRRESAIPLKAPKQRPLRVRLLCGLVLFISTSYFA